MKSSYFDDFAEGFWGGIRLFADIVMAVGAVLSAFVNNLPAPRRAGGDPKPHNR
jgi:hypothetical protein